MSAKDARRFNRSHSRGVASFSMVFCGAVGILGNSVSPAIATTGRITGVQSCGSYVRNFGKF